MVVSKQGNKMQSIKLLPVDNGNLKCTKKIMTLAKEIAYKLVGPIKMKIYIKQPFSSQVQFHLDRFHCTK